MTKTTWSIIVFSVVLIGTSIWYWKFRAGEQEVILQTEKPRYGTVSNSITATGTVEPTDTVIVGTQVSGTIKRVYVDFNSVVKKGQLLVELDKSILQTEVEQKNAALQAAQANLVYQKSNYDRQIQLFNVGVISKSEFEMALYQYNSAKESANSSKAQLRSAEKNLSYADIYSPINGTVLSRSISEGQTVAASFNTPTLFSIAKDLTKMQVQASIDEADIGNVAKGQHVQFTVDAYPTDTFAGTVKAIRLRPVTSANVVTYTTIIDAPNNEMKLKPGMTANIIVYVEEVNDALLISARALNFHPDSILKKTYLIKSQNAECLIDSALKKSGAVLGLVWLKKDSGIIAQPILIGLNDDNNVQVISGLEYKDVVITGYSQNRKGTQAGKTNSSPFVPRAARQE
jgi:HlyD family secretion protein